MSIRLSLNRHQNVVYCLIIMFALLNIALGYVLKGKGLLTFYIIYIVILLLLLQDYSLFRKKIKKSTFFALIGVAILSVSHFLLGLSAISEILTFFLCILFWIVCANCLDGKDFLSWILVHKKIVFTIQIMYYLILALSVFYGDGILADAWGTTTLKGPYQINHLLAYELLGFCCLDLIIWVKEEGVFSTCFCVINGALIVLTGVRSSLFALVLAVFFAFRVKKPGKKIIIVFIGIAALIYLYFKTGLFTALIEKTVYSASLGSASGGRGMIFLSSINSLVEKGGVGSWMFGTGLDSLMSYNRTHIYMNIHAHNDLIDALVQYGIIGLSLYGYSLIKLTKKNLIATIIILTLALSNGYYMYQSIVVMTPIIIAFSSSTKKRKGETHEHELYRILRREKEAGAN